MSKSEDDIKYGTAQARHSEDEAVRVAYKHGDPLEAGKIADSETVDLFSTARNVSKAQQQQGSGNQSQLQQRNDGTSDDTNEAQEREGGSAVDFNTGAPRLPKKGAPSAGFEY